MKILQIDIYLIITISMLEICHIRWARKSLANLPSSATRVTISDCVILVWVQTPNTTIHRTGLAGHQPLECGSPGDTHSTSANWEHFGAHCQGGHTQQCWRSTMSKWLVLLCRGSNPPISPSESPTLVLHLTPWREGLWLGFFSQQRCWGSWSSSSRTPAAPEPSNSDSDSVSSHL